MNEELFVKMINEMIKTSRLEGNISTKDIEVLQNVNNIFTRLQKI